MGVAENHFHVDTQRGIVTTRGQFDRETKAEYTIPIYVYDSNRISPETAAGRKQRSSDTEITTTTSTTMNEQFDIATIIITISDINDHAPEFRPGSCYKLSVPENSEPAVIHTFVATDLDEGANGEIIYGIIGGNIGNKFSINMQTGELTAQQLDREQQSIYFLQIQAQDRGSSNSYQGHCNISVSVEDENDNDPRFEKKQYIVNIPEDAPIGTSVLRINATDPDQAVNARLIFSLANETQWIFAIDNKSGLITTVGPLDREREEVYNFVVVATDGGRHKARSASVPIQIIIDDVNDNKPIFKRYPFRAQVPALIQPGQALLQVTASDLDAGLNGEILYSLKSSQHNKFRINPSTGVLSATQSLASDTGRLLHIEITARDKGNPAQYTNGLIELRVGDLPPTTPMLSFQNETYRLKLRENSDIGTRLLIVNAVRSDGRRQKLIYSFGAGNEEGAFTIDANTGEIKVADSSKLDYERYTGFSSNNNMSRISRELEYAHEMRLIVVAQSEQQQLFAYAELIVELEDANDNSPQFTQREYTATVWEGNNKGGLVVQVTAFDADGANTANSRVLYHIVDGNHDNAFVIEPAFSGIVKTNIVLDREIRDMYRLKVIATDEGVPQLTGTATIRVHIIDVNDNLPTFPPHNVISVSEDFELGSVITTISANDIDTYPTLTYRFGHELPDQILQQKLFAIDRYSGKVILKQQLDYETQQEYQLEIIASDKEHEAHTILTVRVNDINDNPPIFQAQQPPAYYATLPDTTTINTELELLVLNATDADSLGRNSQIQYTLDTTFTGLHINPQTGVLTVNITQLLTNPILSDYFYVLVYATDNGMPSLRSHTIVRIETNTRNAGSAQFLQAQVRAQLKEDASIGSTVLQLNNELLLHANSDKQLSFSIISGNEQQHFELYQSQAIILIKPLDRERHDSHKLRLVMSEQLISSQQLMSQQSLENSTLAINIFINVLDVNDNAPIFIENMKYSSELSELAGLRYSIAQIQATDADQQNTPNTEIVYDITSGNDEHLFGIDLLSGVLYVNKKLDYDKGTNCYELIIRACDSGTLAKCTLQPYQISIQDENDNGPKFAMEEQVAYVAEQSPVGTRVFRALATDLDLGIYGQLNYSLLEENVGIDDISWQLFRIDTISGVVTTNAIFDYEQRQRYDFMLQAMDYGGRTAKLQVRVYIESKDEFPPQFTESTYRFIMPATNYLPLGYVIGQVTAIDRDKGIDGRVVYQLRPQHAYFKLNRTTGAILLKKKLDDKLQEHIDINLLVIASSGKQGSLESKAVIEINLDPLADIGTNLPSSSNSTSSITDWVLALVISVLLLFCGAAGILLFIKMRSRKPRNNSKPHLNTTNVGGNSNSYVDSSAFDTMPIRGNSNITVAASSSTNTSTAQFPPPKYDEIPPYGQNPGSSNSGAATTSELSGSEQSGSSGRGSAEDDGEDEEIRMINERGTLQNSRASDDGRISDISVQNTQQYLARLGIVDREAGNVANSNCSESLPHMFDEDVAAESDITNLIYAKLNDVTGVNSERGSSVDEAGTTAGSLSAAVDHVMGFGDVPVVGTGNVGPSMNGSLSSIVHSEEELTGSYNWDYLLDWGPQYQPLAHVFSEIARLKDDSMSVQSGHSGASARSKKSHIPPPLLTNVAPRAINMPVIANVAASMLPRSPINHDTSGFSTAAAMSPSFSPSLSPLATRSPSISPLGGGPTSHHHMVSLPRHAPQPMQRGKPNLVVEQDMRVRM